MPTYLTVSEKLMDDSLAAQGKPEHMRMPILTLGVHIRFMTVMLKL